MRKIHIIPTCVLLLVSGLSAYAQKGDVKLQGAFPFALGPDENVEGIEAIGEIKGIGAINMGAEYLITDLISIAPNYSFWFKRPYLLRQSLKQVLIGSNLLNIDVRRYFLSDNIQVYGLGGFSIVTVNITSDDTRIGLSTAGINIGAGSIIPLSEKVGIFIEAKYNSPVRAFIAKAGLSFKLR